MPAQWEPQEAIWFGWVKYRPQFYPAVAEMIKGLEGHVNIKLAADSDSLVNVAKQTLIDLGVNISTIEFHVIPGEEYWIRDHGATFLVNRLGELAAVDFDWNEYGSLDWWQLREPQDADSIVVWKQQLMKGRRSKVDSLMGVATNAKIIKSNLVIEGGSIESNGKGVLIQSEAVTLQRNPEWSREEIEAEYKRVLNVDKVIWLKQGLAEDEHMWHLHNRKYVTIGTGGHTDEFVRFADANTILLAWVDEAEKDKHLFSRLNYERMSENLKILEAATDQDGKPFRIIKVPLPTVTERPIVVSEEESDSIVFRIPPTSFLPEERPAIGDTLIQVSASSYLNFLVSNGVLLSATYTQQGTPPEIEEKVRGILEEVFPDRKIVWINAIEQNWNGGGIHCSTQQQPSVQNN
ncbi:agmatine deiminase family protein [Paucihalobacter ruber]|uniref:Agmatine deiminase family protein n=2 Tax=Paucihalobacter ruber TaxID=2567861 RepID=A0A506PS35_9FLAO|nr:agmatine deiminase family protein [Paucihalobacter ruber]